MKTETYDPYEGIQTAIPLLDEHEWAHIPEKDMLKTADDAEMFQYLTGRSLVQVPVLGINAGGKQISLDDYESYTKPWDYAVDLEDDLGGRFTIDGATTNGQNEYPDITSTSIAYTTPHADGTTYTSVVHREKVITDQNAPPLPNKYRYSVSKYEDQATDGGYEPKLTRTKPGELSQADEAAAEKRYVELTNRFKETLELKLARSFDPDKVRRLNNQYDLYEKRKNNRAEAQVGRTRKFLRKLHLTRR